MENYILNNRVNFYYKKLLQYSNEANNYAVFKKIGEFDKYREEFWDIQQARYNVKYIYDIPKYERLELEIVKKHKELFNWLKIWWEVSTHGIAVQRVFETAYVYLTDEGCFGYMNRWKELK